MKKLLTLLAMAGMTCGPLVAADLQVGFVNFKTCVEQSKRGQQERNSLEALKKNMSEMLEKTNKELEEIASKLQDQNYMDGLSPKAEEELKEKFQLLSQDFARYQNQYYQLLNQANYKMLQSMHEVVSHAAEKIRAKNNLSLILNEDSTFAFSKSLDLTSSVLNEMNTQFDQDTQEIASTKED